MSKMFYTAREIAQAIPANYASVLAAIHREELPGSMAGGSYIVNAAPAEAYIKRRQAQADPEVIERLEAEIETWKTKCFNLETELRNARLGGAA